MDMEESALIMQIKKEVVDLEEDEPEFVKIKEEIEDTQGESLDFTSSKDGLTSQNTTENMNYEMPIKEELPLCVEIKHERDIDVPIVANSSVEIKVEPEETSVKVKRSRRPIIQTVECEVCGLVCKDKRTYKLHVMDHTGRPFKCDKCDKAYKKSTDLLYHKKTHTGDHDIHCDVCSKGFTVKSALRAHMRTHSKEKPYVCHICNKGFSHNSSLKPHVALHLDNYNYECKLCPMKFKTYKNLNSHEWKHATEGQKGEQCTLCPKYYKSKEGLRLHLLTHDPVARGVDQKIPILGRKNPSSVHYTCDQCGNSYKHAISLKNHMRIHNGNKFRCHKCDKSYITTKLLNIHIRNHTGETPFSCTVCGKKFRRRDSWLYHKTTHETDRQKYECDLCDKVFVCKGGLRVHKTCVHSNAKAHRCDFCFKSFKLRYDLTRHLRKHKKEEEAGQEKQNEDAGKAGLAVVKEDDDKERKPSKEFIPGSNQRVDVVKMYKCKCRSIFDNESEFKKHKLNECSLSKSVNSVDKDNDVQKHIKEEVTIKTEGDS